MRHFNVEGSRAYFRPEGQVTLDQAVDLIDAAIAFAVEQNVPEILIDIRKLTGYPTPTVADRFFMNERWSATARGRLRMAIVSPPQVINPQRIGVTVAQNRGFVANIFDSEVSAQEWLNALPGRV